MGTPISDAYFGIKLCEILKLDPKKTVNIRIINNVNETVKVQVDQLLQKDEADKIHELMTEFELIKKE